MAPALTQQATAQTPNTCQPGQDLITIPEIRSENGLLRGEITITDGKVTDGKRTLWGSATDPRCIPQDLRYFKGRNLLKPGPEDPAFSTGEPIPGPTLRARVGDLIQIKFLNHVDTQTFRHLARSVYELREYNGLRRSEDREGLNLPEPDQF